MNMKIDVDAGVVAFFIAVCVFLFGVTKCTRDIEVEKYKTKQIELQLKSHEISPLENPKLKTKQ